MDSRAFDDLARSIGSSRSRRGLLKAIGGAALGIIGVSATSGGVFANSGKVGICHVDGQGRFRHISVNANALKAHLAHGDYAADIASDPENCGACGNVCDDGDTCTTSSCVDGACVNTNVPVDCVVSSFGEWSACSVECGDGTQTRTRTVTTPASCGGAACPALEESRACASVCDDGDACTTDACVDGFCQYTNVPVNCVLSEWSEWSACDQVCGGGWETRTRTVVTPASCGGAPCDPTFLEARGCNMQACTCEQTCPDTGACLDGDCFLIYPNCPFYYGVVANGGGINACVTTNQNTGQQCTTSSDCGTDQVCIIQGSSNFCFQGYPL